MIPLRFRDVEADASRMLFTTDTGRSFLGSTFFLENYIRGELSKEQANFLGRFGPSIEELDEPSSINYLYNLSQRQSIRTKLDYFILVPTLRCNLSCSYCQVSRVSEKATGFDWSDKITDAAINMIRESSAQNVKIELQGGEPTLRLDVAETILESVEPYKNSVEMVICTNLSEVSSRLENLLARGNVYISTSIDGNVVRQAKQRTELIETAEAFFENVDHIINQFGIEKISALPTIDPRNPPSYDEIYDAFVSRGFHSVFLRPVNFQGFARKQHAHSIGRDKSWSDYYKGFVRYLIAKGGETDFAVHEFYFVQLLRRIFRARENGHVDLRNPSLFGVDYIVVDYDGRLFPTDEARMLDRIGEVDLSIGDVFAGVDHDKRAMLSDAAFNDDEPDCCHCAFQPYCGSDMIDAISRYGRVDIPRSDTVFCRNQLDLFDFAFGMLSDPTPDERKALTRWLELPEPPLAFLERAP